MKPSRPVAIVTGASRGIGRAIASALAADQFDLVLAARSQDKLMALARELSPSGIRAETLAVDLSIEGSAEKLVQDTLQRFGRLDALINNAGGAPHNAGFSGLKSDDWKLAFDLNFFSIVDLSRAAIEALSKSPQARIVHIGSLTGIEPGFFNPHYAASKAALLNFSKSLSRTLAEKNITVNTVCPGPVETESFSENVDKISRTLSSATPVTSDSIRQTEINKVPLKRLGTAEDVAQMVSFLCSDKANWITGSCFVVDGGKKQSIF